MTLPKRIFFTGVPGSRWSAISQELSILPGFNNSDCSDERYYAPKNYTGHKGAYFGTEMEFTANIEEMEEEYRLQYLNSPWRLCEGTKIVKSHEWAYKLDWINKTFPDDWIMLVYRPDMSSYGWWHQAGGFGITYPSYVHYKDSAGMMAEIIKQNAAILDFAYRNNLVWHHYTNKWIANTFNVTGNVGVTCQDILVTILKENHV